MSDQDPLRFAVLQPGARLHYAVPTLLDRAGLLHRFYTDLCASLGPFHIVDQLWPSALRPPSVQRMLGRKLPANFPRAKVRDVRGTVLTAIMKQQLGFPSGAVSPVEALMKRARAEKFGGANAIYSVIVNDDIDLCLEAKAHGCRIVHEVMLNPDIGLYLDEEHRRFPELPCSLPPLKQIEAGRARDRRKYEIADLILVPSEFVYRSVIELGADPGKVAIVPYGIDESWLANEAATVPGRVLFVGSVGILKGNHYLAAATRRLAFRKIPFKAHVVGPFDPKIMRFALFDGPTYVGQVPRSSVQREFLAADVFVLPSLCEGFGFAHLEALACGVPVITTPNCGSVVRDGVDGFIVPARDAFALAEAIERIITDPELRATMSHNARARAREFTWPRYGERLLGAISRLQGRPLSEDVGLCSTR